MTGSLPSVSIAMRAYRHDWCREAVASVLNQSHSDVELVIYDDAGTFEQFARDLADDRVRYCRATRRLQPAGRFQAAVSLCRAPIIGVIDDDDRYERTFVFQLLQALAEHPRAGIAFCRTTWIAGETRIVPVDRRPAGVQADVARRMLLDGWTVSPSHMLMRREALEAAWRAQPMPDAVAPDYFVNVRVAIAGWHHVLVDAPLVTCRWHDDQLSRRFPAACDLSVATFRELMLADSELETLRRRRLGRSLLVRALGFLERGDLRRARDDLRAARQAAPDAWPLERLMLSAGACSRVTAQLGTLAWRMTSRARRRAHPPLGLGDR